MARCMARCCDYCYNSKPIIGQVPGTQVLCLLTNKCKQKDDCCRRWKRHLSNKEILQRRLKLQRQLDRLHKSIEKRSEKLEKEIYNLRYQCDHRNKQIEYETWWCKDCGMSR